MPWAPNRISLNQFPARCYKNLTAKSFDPVKNYKNTTNTKNQCKSNYQNLFTYEKYPKNVTTHRERSMCMCNEFGDFQCSTMLKTNLLPQRLRPFEILPLLSSGKAAVGLSMFHCKVKQFQHSTPFVTFHYHNPVRGSSIPESLAHRWRW